jgi:hypothetical protein
MTRPLLDKLKLRQLSRVSTISRMAKQCKCISPKMVSFTHSNSRISNPLSVGLMESLKNGMLNDTQALNEIVEERE